MEYKHKQSPLPPLGEKLARRPAQPGQGPIVMLGLTLGFLLMGIQLWLLTLAFNLYLSGERGQTVGVSIISGFVFLGGLGMLRLLDRMPGRSD